ncbi:PHD finger protein 14 [Geranomyces variabilis]|nr:PHD finger protein 14 [Geranomyces variabilis]
MSGATATPTRQTRSRRSTASPAVLSQKPATRRRSSVKAVVDSNNESAATPQPTRRRSSVKLPLESAHDGDDFARRRCNSFTANPALIAWRKAQPPICCICMHSTDAGPIIACANPTCTVVVHSRCRPSTPPPSIKTLAGEWLCQRCSASDPDIAACALCPNPDGLLERIEHTAFWVHTLCKMWILNHRDGRPVREKEMRNGALDAKLWAKPCSLCSATTTTTTTTTTTDFGAPTNGCTRACDAHGCKNSVHAPCAAAYGLLETEPNPDLSDPHFVFCKVHGSNDPRLNAWAKWARTKHEILAKLDGVAAAAAAARVATPTDLLDPRTAMDTFYANFEQEQRRAIAQLQRDELQYAAEEKADRNMIARLCKEAKWLEQATADAQRMDDTATADALALQHQLSRIFPFLKQADAGFDATPANIIDTVFVSSDSGSGVKPAFAAAFDVAYNIASAYSSPPLSRDCIGTTPKAFAGRGRNATKSPSHGVETHMGLCTICKTFEGTPTLTTTTAARASPSATPPLSQSTSAKQPDLSSATARRLIRCSTCGCSFHLGCLDPPMKKMPPRGYAWQCESCDETPDDDDDESDDGDEDDESSPNRKRKERDDGSESDSEVADHQPRPKRNRGPPVRFQ